VTGPVAYCLKKPTVEVNRELYMPTRCGGMWPDAYGNNVVVLLINHSGGLDINIGM
jgi:hypothetical protein